MQALELATQQEHPELPSGLRTVLTRLERLRSEIRAQGAATAADAGAGADDSGALDTVMAGADDDADLQPPRGDEARAAQPGNASAGSADASDAAASDPAPSGAPALGAAAGPSDAPQLDWPSLGAALAAEPAASRADVQRHLELMSAGQAAIAAGDFARMDEVLAEMAPAAQPEADAEAEDGSQMEVVD